MYVSTGNKLHKLFLLANFQDFPGSKSPNVRYKQHEQYIGKMQRQQDISYNQKTMGEVVGLVTE